MSLEQLNDRIDAIKALAKHPLTDLGLQQFLADYAKGNG